MSDNSKTQMDNLILPTFLIMLLDVADLIFEKMDPMDLLTTRKVSRDLRTAVDKFGICFDEIRVSTYVYCRRICIYFNETEIEYRKDYYGGMKVTHERKTWKIDEENFVERAFKDLKPLLQSNYINFELEKYVGDPYKIDDYPYVNIFPLLMAWLESEKCVRVDYLGLSDFLFDEVLTILPYLDAKTLKVIRFNVKDQLEQFERITNLDQWTNDIKFILDYHSKFNMDQIEHLFHIKSFEITVDEFSVQNAIKIRDDLMKISTFDSCKITFDASKINRIDIANVFDLNSTRRYPWRFKYSNEQDRFWIRIAFYHDNSVYTLYVKRIDSSKMQQNNLILPTLPKSPLDVVDLVAEKLEHMHRLTIRKVCRGFRAAVDHFGVRFDTIYFTIDDSRIEMYLDEECIAYNDAVSCRTTVAYKEQKSVIENGNYFEMALNDLKMLLKCAPSLSIYDRTKEKDDMIITSFLDFLEKEQCIHVKGIHFEWFSYDDVIAILQYCDAQTLEDIRVMGYGSSDELKAIFNFDQWKMAKRFVLQEERFEMKLFEHLFHFEEFEIEYCQLTVQNAIQIRDDLMGRSTFKNFRIKLSISETTEVFEIAKVFKPDVDSKESYDFEYSNENSEFKIGIGEEENNGSSMFFKCYKC